MSEKYYVAGFFDRNYRGVDDNLMTDSYDDAITLAWKLVNDGDYIQIKDMETGKETRFSSDEILDGTDYEFGNLEDIFHSVFIDEEPLKEASYGGAFDIEDNQFFTRDDLNDLAYAVEEYTDGNVSVDDIYMDETGNTLTVELTDTDGESYTVSFDIDYRKIRKPNDLLKYVSKINTAYKNQKDMFNSYFNHVQSFYGEDIQESIETPYGPYWYYTKHGVGPGSVPRDITILKYAYDEENDPWGTYFLSDKLILTDELKWYDLKEKKPPMNAVDNNGELIFQDDDYTQESLTESDDDMLANEVKPMADAIHKAEDDGEGKFYVTYSFGLDDNGSITGGVDIRCRKDEYEEQAKSTIEDIFNKYGYELDSRFKVNPGKTLFGGTHYQVIKKRTDL